MRLFWTLVKAPELMREVHSIHGNNTVEAGFDIVRSLAPVDDMECRSCQDSLFFSLIPAETAASLSSSLADVYLEEQIIGV
jgi:hypothetical protein